MRLLRLLLWTIPFLAFPALAQNAVQIVATDPAGACTNPSYTAVNATTGQFSNCAPGLPAPTGTWTKTRASVSAEFGTVVSVNPVGPCNQAYAVTVNVSTTAVSTCIAGFWQTGPGIPNFNNPALPQLSVQWNAGNNLFGGSLNFVWNNSLQQLQIVGLPGTAGLYAQSSFLQSDLGFVGGAMYPSIASACSALNPPPTGTLGGLGYQGGSTYCFWNATTSTWGVFNFSTSVGPGGPTGAVQFAQAGAFGGTGALVYNQSLNQLVLSSGAGVSSNGGYVSTLGAITAFTGSADGASLQGILAAQNAGATIGGYMHFAPVTYNPYNQPGVCKDQYGNPVQIPLPLSGDTFGANDAVMWVSESPLLPAAPTSACPNPGGAPLPAQETWGLNVNTYFLAMGGLATTSSAFNSIESLSGGAYVQLAFTTNYGLIMLNNSTCSSMSPLTGANAVYGGLGYQGSGTYCVWNGTAWAPTTLTGGGGGSAPGGPTNSVQINGGGAIFAGNSWLAVNTSTQALQIVSTGTQSCTLGGSCTGTAVEGLILNAGYMISQEGYVAANGTNALAYTAFNAPHGGMAALSFTAASYTAIGSSAGAPALTAGQSAFPTGTLYYDTVANCIELYTTSFACLSGGSGSPGGALNYVQYYGAGGVFAGNSGFQFFPSTQQVAITGVSSSQAALSVHTGYIETQYGLVEDLVNSYNAVNLVGSTGGCTASTPCSGGLARSWRATTYMGTGNFSASLGSGPTSTTGDTFAAGDLSYSTASSCEAVYNGSTWTCITSGGIAQAAGSPTQVQFNNGGSPNVLGASSNFTWTNGSQVLAVTGTVTASVGFLSTCTLTNCFNDPVGGIRTLTATFGGPNGANPNPIALIGTSGSGSSQHTGIVFDTASGTTLWQLATDPLDNGSSNFGLYSAGVGTYIAQWDYSTGHLGIGGTPLTGTGQWLYVHGTTNTAGIAVLNGYVQADGGFLSGSLAQGSIQTAGGFNANDLGTASVPAFSINSVGVIALNGAYSIGGTVVINSSSQFIGSAVNVTGVVQSQVTGSSIAFQLANSNFQLNGNGLASFAGGVVVNLATTTSVETTGGFTADYASGSTQPYSVGSTVVINNALQFVGTAVNVTGAVQSQATGTAIAFQTANSNIQMNGNGVISVAGGFVSNSTSIGIQTNPSSGSIIYIGNSGTNSNFYNRYLSGPSTAVSCSGVANGWTAISTDNYFVTCQGGTRYRAALTSF